jgi:F1F0 ATPase subunit 2
MEWTMTLQTIVLSFTAGMAAGALHYWSLWWNVQQLAAQGVGMKVVAIQLLRLAVVAGVLIVAALFGAMSLLATALGILAARLAAVRLVGKTP